MWIASVPAAAPPLPGTAPGAAPPEEAAACGEAAPFDEALAFSLRDEQRMPGGIPMRRVADPLSLAEWFLVGMPADRTAELPSAKAIPSEDVVEDDIDLAAGDDGGETEIPIDVLQAVPVAQPQLVPVHTQAVEIPASVAAGNQVNVSVGLKQDAGTTLETTATPNATKADMTAPTQQVLPEGEVEVHTAEPHDAVRLKPEAPAKSEAPVKSDAMPKTDTVENRDATLKAEPSAPLDRSAGVSAPAVTHTVAGARHVAGANAPALPVTVAAEPPVTQPVTTAAEPAPVVQAPVQGVEREARDTTIAIPRVLSPAAPMAHGDSQMGGGDAQGFGNDGRRSPAAQRLAAALTMAAPSRAHDTGSGSAPVFSVPAQPAAVAAPVAAPAVVATPTPGSTHVDAENVHTLVQAMRITAKAGGWEATVRLKPEHLGEVTIALRVDGKNVSAVVQAESAGVRQWLMSQEDAVRSGMSEHGLQLDRFVVSRDGQRREADDQQPQQQPRRRAPRQSAAGSEQQHRFEIVV